MSGGSLFGVVIYVCSWWTYIYDIVQIRLGNFHDRGASGLELSIVINPQNIAGVKGEVSMVVCVSYTM